MSKTNLELCREFSNLPTDVERWKWLKNHQGIGIELYLDNDDTFVVFPDDNGKEVPAASFDQYIGWAAGVFSLLQAVGIEGEAV